jgi:acetoin utilization deacetylase AcuC-like enzyme
MPALIPTTTMSLAGSLSGDQGLRERERYVVQEIRRRGIPLVAVIGGGYSADVDGLARRHALVFEAMAQSAPAAG